MISDLFIFLTDFLPLFLKEETTKECPVIVIDDSLYENEEKFYVSLTSYLGSRINSERNTSVVVIAPDTKDGKSTHYINRLKTFLSQASRRPNAFPGAGRGFQLITLPSSHADAVSCNCLKSGVQIFLQLRSQCCHMWLKIKTIYPRT